jgi:rhodanese-related sulfurtransferase
MEDVVEQQQVEDLTPQDVSAGIAEGRYLLVDVREPNEVAAEAYPDATVVPLSGFDPADLPDPKGREIVFACRSGKRSVTASLAAQAAGLPHHKHLAGGILAWKTAGLPTKV